MARNYWNPKGGLYVKGWGGAQLNKKTEFPGAFIAPGFFDQSELNIPSIKA